MGIDFWTKQNDRRDKLTGTSQPMHHTKPMSARERARRHGVRGAQRLYTVRRSPRGYRMTDEAWTCGLSAYVDQHGTPKKPNRHDLSLMRMRRDLRRHIKASALAE